MSLPGTTVTLVDTAQPRSVPTDTSVAFIVGFAQKGPPTPLLVTSMAGYAKTFGDRVAYGSLYDWLDAAFHEGLGRAYVARVTGPSPVLATHNLLDGSSAIALVAKAKSYGDWGNLISVGVAAGVGGGTFVIYVQYNGVEVERSGDLATTTDAVNWSAGSSYINLIQGASTNDPAVAAAAALTGGTDDHGSATETQWAAALATFYRDLGPGQVAMPGRTADSAHLDLLAHAASHNRVALIDLEDTATAATLLTDGAAATAGGNGRWGAAFAPWAIVPGVTRGTTRTVPYSAIQAGMIARNDGAGRNANEPAAGRNGVSVYATGLTQTYTDADRESLNDAGIDVAILKLNQVRTYGYRTLASPTTESNYILLSNMRLIMAITAEADVIAENYLFQEIDGQGHLISDFQGDLTGMLMPYYTRGALYGATPAEAFYVDVGAQVNTPDTIAALELHAILDLRMSQFGETVQIEIIKKTVTEAVV